MQGRSFMAVARTALEDPTEEWLRTAASRAYYALFVETRDALNHWQIGPLPMFQAHAFVRSRMLFATNADAREIGRALEELYALRVHADYENARSFPSSFIVEQALDDAEDAIAPLDEIAADAPRQAALLAAIRAVP